jgi:hypothetical protein
MKTFRLLVKRWNCCQVDFSGKFTENYPDCRFHAVSYAINDECEWVLEL